MTAVTTITITITMIEKMRIDYQFVPATFKNSMAIQLSIYQLEIKEKHKIEQLTGFIDRVDIITFRSLRMKEHFFKKISEQDSHFHIFRNIETFHR